jgi:hypothetical protein
MRENEFEKRVQEKMSAFDLAPSGEVWQQVERRIRKEKKRRFIFWWPLFFLLAAGGLAAGILLTTKKEKTGSITANKIIDSKTPSSANKTNGAEPISVSDTAGKTGNSVTSEEEKNVPVGTPVTTIPQAHPPVVVPPTGKKEPRFNISKRENKDTVTGSVKIIDRPKDVVDKPTGSVPGTPQPDEPLKEPFRMNDLTVAEKKNELPQKTQPGEKTQPDETVQLKTDSAVKEQTKKNAGKKTNNWDWGFSFSAGRSAIVDGLNFFTGPLYAEASTLQTGSSGNPSFSPVSRSVMRPSFSWSAGFYRRNILSEKLQINIGLSYSYLSTRIDVGNRVDSSRSINNTYSQGLTISDFYRPSGTENYTNRFHFISLSGDLSWRIINGNKVKLYWENGLQYSRLFGSSMLHYDRGLPGYYKDNKLLTKNNLFFTTGLSAPLGTRWSVNPFASYSLTRVLKNTDSSRTHYSNFGIRIRYLLDKK